MNNPFQTTTVKEKAIEAAHTAQATVQKAKHRVQEIHGIIHFLFFRSAKVKNKTGIITFILPESVFPIIEEKISLPVSRRILTGRLITLTLKHITQLKKRIRRRNLSIPLSTVYG